MNRKEAEFVKSAAYTLRKVAEERNSLATENTDLKLKVAAYERRTQAEKVAAQMHQKGIRTDIDFSSLVTDLEKAAMEGKLATIEEAVEMVAPDMSFKTASIHDTPTGAGEHDLERYLLGSIG
jgi:hypothetical protein